MIQTYTPTASLSGSERTKANYHQAIKTFVLSNEYIGKYLELESENDGNLTFTLKTKSSLGLSQIISYKGDNNFHYWYWGRATNSYTLSLSYSISKDTVFTVVDLPDIFFLMQDNVFLFSIAKATAFDEKRTEYILISSNTNFSYFYKGSETTSRMNINSNAIIMSECTGYSNTYVLEKLFISGTDLICNSVYVARGGITLPPSGMSTIGGRRFYRLQNTNVMLLVE